MISYQTGGHGSNYCNTIFGGIKIHLPGIGQNLGKLPILEGGYRSMSRDLHIYWKDSYYGHYGIDDHNSQTMFWPSNIWEYHCWFIIYGWLMIWVFLFTDWEPSNSAREYDSRQLGFAPCSERWNWSGRDSSVVKMIYKPGFYREDVGPDSNGTTFYVDVKVLHRFTWMGNLTRDVDWCWSEPGTVDPVWCQIPWLWFVDWTIPTFST